MLRFQEARDIDFLVRLWSDPATTEFMGGPRAADFLVSEFSRVAADPRAEKYDLWPVVLAETAELVGHAGLIPKEIDGEELIELTYLIDGSFRGAGYATEIARALVTHAFSRFGLPTLVALIDPLNAASVRVAEKAGMTLWKRTRRSDGSTKLVYRVTRDRFSTLPAGS